MQAPGSLLDAPFVRRPRRLRVPRDMAVAPLLDPALPAPGLARRRALLVNPFYPKDPHASFGKHVLTPTLALTSVAAATPPGWRVAYWDENLLQGRPPWDPLPEVVGITVHLTFARRAYALADWYRARGSTVVLGGLHVLSCPDEAAPHADALAIGDGVQSLAAHPRDVANGRLEPRYHGGLRAPLPRRPGAAARPRAARQLPHDDEPHRHAGLPQPLRLLLPLDARLAHAVRHARRRAGRARVRGRRAAVRRLRRQQPRLAARTTCARCAGRFARSAASGARRSRSTSPTTPRSCARWRSAAAPASSSASSR